MLGIFPHGFGGIIRKNLRFDGQLVLAKNHAETGKKKKPNDYRPGKPKYHDKGFSNPRSPSGQLMKPAARRLQTAHAVVSAIARSPHWRS